MSRPPGGPTAAQLPISRDLRHVFGGLHRVVRGRVDQLGERYAVDVRGLSAAELVTHDGAVAGWVVTPEQPGCSALTVLLHERADCPEVSLRYGRRWQTMAPTCPCDECGEDLDDVLRAVDSDLAEVTAGITELVRVGARVEVGSVSATGTAQSTVHDRRTARALGLLRDERHSWPPWRWRGLPDDVEVVAYEHPDVAALVRQIQSEYRTRYGGEDETPLQPQQLSPPEGLFLLAYSDGAPVAMGGWRRHDEWRSGRVPGRQPAEIKRMYVSPAARGRGYARRLLAELERTAALSGCDQMVLETGQAQPEAVALYRSAGYRDIPGFGHYCASDLSVHLGKPLAVG